MKLHKKKLLFTEHVFVQAKSKISDFSFDSDAESAAKKCCRKQQEKQADEKGDVSFYQQERKIFPKQKITFWSFDH